MFLSSDGDGDVIIQLICATFYTTRNFKLFTWPPTIIYTNWCLNSKGRPWNVYITDKTKNPQIRQI